MAANPERRRLLADAALECLGNGGSRALTHRAVDRQAQVPPGTTGNYFPSRGALMRGLIERIFERLSPDPQRVAAIAAEHSGSAALVAYTQYVVQRLLDAPALALGLIEIRLEAARNREIAAIVTPFLGAGALQDELFHRSAKLPGSVEEVGLLHYAINGLVLDRLTAPIDPTADPAQLAAELVQKIVPAAAQTAPPG